MGTAATYAIVGGAVLLPTLLELVHPGKAGPAVTAAMDTLRARGGVGGVTFSVSNDPTDTYRAMRTALPAKLSLAQIDDVCDAWLAAWRAGHDAGGAAATDFSLLGPGGLAILDNMGLDACDGLTDKLGAVGRAVCALSTARNSLSFSYDDGDVSAALDRVGELAAAMAAADYVADGDRKSDHVPDLGDDIVNAITGALEKFLTGTALIIGVVVVGGILVWKAVP